MVPYELLERVVGIFERLGIPYLVTGSVAAMAYGEPRFTNDIDIVAAIAEQQIPPLVAAFPAEDYYISPEMIRVAIREQSQFNIIHPASGLKVDVIIRRDTPFDRSRFQRTRRIHPAPSYEADFATPEDVIIKKMEYYREGGSEKHLRDITGMLVTSGNEIDRDYIRQWAEKLNLNEIWRAILARLNAG
jgi:hypothetical protein